MAMAEVQAPGRRTRVFTAGEVDRMVEAGILAEDERVELIDGELVLVSPQGPEHEWVVTRLDALLQARLGAQAEVLTHAPLALPAGRWAVDVPEPDVVVIPPRARPGRPEAGEALLVVEVGVTSARWDVQVKRPIYARARVSELWLIDVGARSAQVLTGPEEDGSFAVRRDLGEAEPLTLPLGAGEILLGEVLPPR